MGYEKVMKFTRVETGYLDLWERTSESGLVFSELQILKDIWNVLKYFTGIIVYRGKQKYKTYISVQKSCNKFSLLKLRIFGFCWGSQTRLYNLLVIF